VNIAEIIDFSCHDMRFRLALFTVFSPNSLRFRCGALRKNRVDQAQHLSGARLYLAELANWSGLNGEGSAFGVMCRYAVPSPRAEKIRGRFAEPCSADGVPQHAVGAIIGCSL
jgi:hypothetical protein